MTGTSIKLTGNQVKFIRTRLAISQAALAARLAVSQPVIFRIERKADEVLTGPEIILIAQIAEEAGVAIPSSDECSAMLSSGVSA